MDVMECLRTRLTVRAFRPDPVPAEVIEKILEAGRLAPSSRNLQPWHFIVVRNPDTLRAIGAVATSGRFVADAPMAIAIAMENADRPELDAGRVLQQMELAAWSEGLGTCFVGLRVAEQNRQVKELLGIPDQIELVTVLPFGYRPQGMRGTGPKQRKSLNEVTHGEQFGQRYKSG